MTRYLSQKSKSRKLWLFCEVTPPDEEGFCNTGYSAPFPLSLYENCKVIGLINESMPPTYGDTAIPVRVFDHFVRLPDSRLPLFPEPVITEAVQRIGLNVAEVIEDGSTVEVGVGSVTSTILRALSNKTRLRIRSGLLPEDIKGLVEEGVVTERCVGNITGAYSPDFYDWLRMNPAVEIKTMEYTHNVLAMSQQPKFAAINSAICVDLLGQVVSETTGPTQITGLGGALDFARGACLSGGKSIIAMTAGHGEARGSRIVPLLEKGNVVSLTRYDVDYVITEYGIAELRYKTRRERVLNIINVAHPDHRQWLQKRAKRLKLL